MAGGKLKPTNQQPTLSRFFAQSPTKQNAPVKRKASTSASSSTAPVQAGKRDNSAVIDLTTSDDDQCSTPPTKKRKTAHVNKHLFLPDGTPTPEPEPEPQHTDSSTRAPTAPSSPVQERRKYAASEPTVNRSASELLEMQQTRARMARALIADNNSFHRSRDGGSSDHEKANGTEEEDEEDDKFKELQAAFALKPSKSQAKGKKVAAPPKKGKEVGPSGQTYTPLELQVCTTVCHTILMAMLNYELLGQALEGRTSRLATDDSGRLQVQVLRGGCKGSATIVALIYCSLIQLCNR